MGILGLGCSVAWGYGKTTVGERDLCPIACITIFINPRGPSRLQYKIESL